MSFVLGVTGGIATGKSTAVAHFRSLGLPIIDADIIAREVVEPNTEGLQAVKQAFGPQILTDDGHLDRQTLGALIFNDPEKRRILNQTLSPFIRQEILSQIEEKKQEVPLLIVDIPLLYEADYDQYMDQTAVVYVPEAIQKERLMARNQLTEQEAQQRIDSQLSIEKKKQRADIVFDNQGTIAQLNQQIDDWFASINK